jgi:outer membrane murein-binding lipoprotein Lpp
MGEGKLVARINAMTTSLGNLSSVTSAFSAPVNSARSTAKGRRSGAFRANHEIDRRQSAQHVASQNLAQPASQPVTRHRGRLMARHDESEPRVTRIIVTPGQIEVLRAATVAPAPTAPHRLSRHEPNRAWYEHGAGPLARLPAPMFDGIRTVRRCDPARRRDCGAAPRSFHPRAKSVLIDAPPIAQPIRRTHRFLRVRPGKLPDATRDGQG